MVVLTEPAETGGGPSAAPGSIIGLKHFSVKWTRFTVKNAA
jgi:hypothetical protein